MAHVVRAPLSLHLLRLVLEAQPVLEDLLVQALLAHLSVLQTFAGTDRVEDAADTVITGTHLSTQPEYINDKCV